MKNLMKTVVAATVAATAIAASASAEIRPSWRNKASSGYGSIPFSITIHNTGHFHVIVKDGASSYFTHRDDGVTSLGRGQSKTFILQSDTHQVSWKVECAGYNFNSASVKDLRPHAAPRRHNNGDFKGSADDDIRLRTDGNCFHYGQWAEQGPWIEPTNRR